MTRPARSPPACRLVRPPQTMPMLLPNSRSTASLPRRNPSPIADSTTIDTIAPQDPEHRQEAAQLVGAQVLDRLAIFEGMRS